jgi:hypothetical protein
MTGTPMQTVSSLSGTRPCCVTAASASAPASGVSATQSGTRSPSHRVRGNSRWANLPLGPAALAGAVPGRRWAVLFSPLRDGTSSGSARRLDTIPPFSPHPDLLAHDLGQDLAHAAARRRIRRTPGENVKRLEQDVGLAAIRAVKTPPDSNERSAGGQIRVGASRTGRDLRLQGRLLPRARTRRSAPCARRGPLRSFRSNQETPSWRNLICRSRHFDETESAARPKPV